MPNNELTSEAITQETVDVYQALMGNADAMNWLMNFDSFELPSKEARREIPNEDDDYLVVVNDAGYGGLLNQWHGCITDYPHVLVADIKTNTSLLLIIPNKFVDYVETDRVGLNLKRFDAEGNFIDVVKIAVGAEGFAIDVVMDYILGAFDEVGYWNTPEHADEAPF